MQQEGREDDCVLLQVHDHVQEMETSNRTINELFKSEKRSY